MDGYCRRVDGRRVDGRREDGSREDERMLMEMWFD